MSGLSADYCDGFRAGKEKQNKELVEWTEKEIEKLNSIGLKGEQYKNSVIKSQMSVLINILNFTRVKK